MKHATYLGRQRVTFAGVSEHHFDHVVAPAEIHQSICLKRRPQTSFSPTELLLPVRWLCDGVKRRLYAFATRVVVIVHVMGLLRVGGFQQAFDELVLIAG